MAAGDGNAVLRLSGRASGSLRRLAVG